MGSRRIDAQISYLESVTGKPRKVPRLRVGAREPSSNLSGFRRKLREKLARVEARIVELIQTRVDDTELEWLRSELKRLNDQREALLESLA